MRWTWADNTTMDTADGVAMPAAGPPAAFVALVRDALAHLHDAAHLYRHPLHRYLGEALPQAGDKAQSLRAFLFDAIERLEAPGSPDWEKDRRPYLVLEYRYVGGLSPDAIAERLHIGTRQVRREHKKGLLALAEHLWGRRTGQDGVGVPEGAGDSLASEMDMLGVDLEGLPLATLVASVEAEARALAAHYGVGLSVTPVPAGLVGLGDRTLARQALLSGVSALVGRRPRFLEVAPDLGLRLPSLLLSVSPPISGPACRELRREMATGEALMAAQKGSVALLTAAREDTAGPADSCAGLRFVFAHPQGAHVLAIDDNEKMLQLYERYLLSGRYRVSVAASAAEAEVMLERGRPDLILLDVMMRDTDGWALLQRLRSRPDTREVPVVICSVLNEPRLAQALGAQAYLKKPIVVGDLLATVNMLLAGSSPAAPR